MARATLYPRANRTAQWWATKFLGSTLEPVILLVHSTEGPSWPGYNGGASAPTLTTRWNPTTGTLDWRQHFPINKSARALENRAGGVQTNTRDVVQVEVVGTCDPRTKAAWEKKGLKAGRDFIYLPDPGDAFIAEFAMFVQWLHAEWPSFPIRDAAPRGWLAYGPDSRRPGVTPASYGASPARMSFAEWLATKGGIVGHQHAPENSHGDPGAFPAGKVVAAALGQIVVSGPEPIPPAAAGPVWGVPETWKIGASSADVTRLGQRLVVHAKALGLPIPYKVGPGPTLTAVDVAFLKSWQEAQGWTGDGADGYAGPVSFRLLDADPVVVPKPPAPVTPPAAPTGVACTYLVFNVNGEHMKSKPDPRDPYDVLGPDFKDRAPAIAQIIRESGCTFAYLPEVGSLANAELVAKHAGPGWVAKRQGESTDLGMGTIAQTLIETIVAHGLGKAAGAPNHNRYKWTVLDRANAPRRLAVGFHAYHKSGRVYDLMREVWTRNMVKGVKAIAAKYGVLEENIIYLADANSARSDAYDGPGRALAAAGFTDIETATGGGINGLVASYIGTSRVAKYTGRQIDRGWAKLTARTKAVAWWVLTTISGGRIVGTVTSDHLPVAVTIRHTKQEAA